MASARWFYSSVRMTRGATFASSFAYRFSSIVSIRDPICRILLGADPFDIDDLLGVMHKGRDPVFIAAHVEDRQTADKRCRRERLFQVARIAPRPGIDGIGPLPHRINRSRLLFDELPNPSFGHNPHVTGFPYMDPGRQFGWLTV